MSYGYYTGVTDVYYAKFSTDDTSAAAPTYGTPAVLGMSIEVTITPRYKEGQLYASNKKVRQISKIDGYDVSLNLDQIEAAVRSDILGRTVDTKGVQIIDGDATAPNVAIMFALTKDNGHRELWCLYKGVFQELETSGSTEGDAIEYQTPTISGSFERRIHDNRLAVVVDEDDDDADATTIAGWFSGVYEATLGT